MTANIDAVATSDEIKATYRRYLQSLLAVRDPKIDAALRDAIDGTPDARQGAIPGGDPAVRAGVSYQELIDEGVLCQGFAGLASDALPLDRPLYVHQEQAIRKAAAGRNVVVATGTGSGKTGVLPAADPRQPGPRAASAARWALACARCCSTR